MERAVAEANRMLWKRHSNDTSATTMPSMPSTWPGPVLHDPDGVVTYDDRLDAAARHNDLAVISPSEAP